MSTPMELFNERMQIRNDMLAHKIPKRVPVYPNFTLESACGLAGIELKKAHYNVDLMEQAYTKVCETFYADAMSVINLRFPSTYQLLGARNWVMGSDGTVQHPEIETMRAEDYDAYTAAPFSFIQDELLPRVCAGLDTDPVNRSLALAKAYANFADLNGRQFGVMMKLAGQFGYGPGMITGKLMEAPFDFLADQLRGFKGITMDVRRVPDKVEAAVKATTPLMVKQGAIAAAGSIDFMPLHLAPYINRKTFDRLYWPTLKEVVEALDAKGIATTLYAEEDWTRYADALCELPESSIVWFESGDYKQLKETVGQKHVIGGFYDPTITLARSKEQCIDEAKRLLDTCMPGGNFYFAFDKSVMDIRSIDVSKLAAVLEWVSENAVY